MNRVTRQGAWIIGAAVSATLTGGGASIVATSPPAKNELGCSGDKEPVAVERDLYDRSLLKWQCGHPPSCPSNQEPVWLTSYDNLDVRGECQARCAEGEMRGKGGCYRPKTADEEAKQATENAEFWRKEHPGRACMKDCAEMGRKCVVERRFSPDCQGVMDECSVGCRGLPP